MTNLVNCGFQLEQNAYFCSSNQFSKTAYFSDQKISNTWSKKAWRKRTLIMHIISMNIFKSWLYFINIQSQTPCDQKTNSSIMILYNFNENNIVKLRLYKKDAICNFFNKIHHCQFSKTAHFSDQKISNTWSKKASWKRTLIDAHYFSEHL